MLGALPAWDGARTVALTLLGSPGLCLPTNSPGHRPGPQRCSVGYQGPAPFKMQESPGSTAATLLNSIHGL